MYKLVLRFILDRLTCSCCRSETHNDIDIDMDITNNNNHNHFYNVILDGNAYRFIDKDCFNMFKNINPLYEAGKDVFTTSPSSSTSSTPINE